MPVSSETGLVYYYFLQNKLTIKDNLKAPLEIIDDFGKLLIKED